MQITYSPFRRYIDSSSFNTLLSYIAMSFNPWPDYNVIIHDFWQNSLITNPTIYYEKMMFLSSIHQVPRFHNQSVEIPLVLFFICDSHHAMTMTSFPDTSAIVCWEVTWFLSTNGCGWNARWWIIAEWCVLLVLRTWNGNASDSCFSNQLMYEIISMKNVQNKLHI